MPYDPLSDDRRLLPDYPTDDDAPCSVCDATDDDGSRCEDHDGWEEHAWQGMPCWWDRRHYYSLVSLDRLDEADEDIPPTPSPQDLAAPATIARLLGLGGAR